MSRIYHSKQRELQRVFDSERLADRIEEVLCAAELDEKDRALIEAADMFFLATADAEGRPNCSYKGGDPGFVRVVDGKTVAFPSYDGNGMFLSAGNILANPNVGLLFIDFEKPNRLRLNGVASISPHDPLLSEYQGAQFIVRVQVREAFPNCSRYIHRYQLVERSAFIPRRGTIPPEPDWKSSSWASDVLPDLESGPT